MLRKEQRIEVLEKLGVTPTAENLLIVERTEWAVEKNLPSIIEGMEVSIDVSTCPDGEDGDKRLFGIVNECMESTGKNEMILLVYETENNYDIEQERTRFESQLLRRLKVEKPDTTEAVFARSDDGCYQLKLINSMWWAWRTSVGCKEP